MGEESRLMIVPADAVIQRGRVLLIRIWCKGYVGGTWTDEGESLIKGERKPVVTHELE
jgi:hypothetical protein